MKNIQEWLLAVLILASSMAIAIPVSSSHPSVNEMTSNLLHSYEPGNGIQFHPAQPSSKPLLRENGSSYSGIPDLNLKPSSSSSSVADQWHDNIVDDDVSSGTALKADLRDLPHANEAQRSTSDDKVQPTSSTLITGSPETKVDKGKAPMLSNTTDTPSNMFSSGTERSRSPRRTKKRSKKPIDHHQSDTSPSRDVHPTLTALLEQTRHDGSKRTITQQEVFAYIGMIRHKLKYKRTKRPRYQLGEVIKSSSDLPFIRGRRYLPNTTNFDNMAREEQLKWINTITQMHDDLRRDEEEEQRYKAKMPRIAADQLQNGVKEEDLTTEQQIHLRFHRQRFKSEIESTERYGPDWKSYLYSHRALRGMGIPLMEIPLGRQQITFHRFKERVERKHQKGAENRKSEAAKKRAAPPNTQL